MEGDRPRVAVWSPFPPQQSGIADYTEELLRCLSRRYDIEVFVDDGCLPVSTLLRTHRVQHFLAFDRRHRQHPFDLVVYQLGRSLLHLYMHEALQRHRGVVVLHELAWSHVLYRDSLDRGAVASFESTLRELEGEGALQEFHSLQRRKRRDRPVLMEDFLNRHPMLGVITARSLTQIVHLEDAAVRLRRWYPNARPRTVPMGVSDPYARVPQGAIGDVRRRLGIPEEAVVVGAFGVVHPVKRLDACLSAFAEAAAAVPDARLVLVGPAPDERYVRHLFHLADQLGVLARIRITGHVARGLFDHYLIACDAIVNLRTPSTTHVSATLLRAMAAGKPVLLSDLPDWRMVTDDSLIRIPTGDDEVPRLAQFLRLLATDVALRRRLSASARRSYLASATIDRMAEGYGEVIDALLADRQGWGEAQNGSEHKRRAESPVQ